MRAIIVEGTVRGARLREALPARGLPFAGVVLRTLVITVALALVLAPEAFAQGSTSTLLMPGVTYTKRVQFTPHGPVVLNVITAPRPGGLYSLEPALSNDAIVGAEKVTDIEKRLSTTATVAGVNGDLFNFADGHPSGVLMQNGVLEHPPLAGRTSVGIGSDGTLRADRVAMLGFWRGTGQRLRVGLNDPPSAGAYALFTPAFGPTTPPATAPAAEIVLSPFPSVAPNAELTGVVTAVSSPSSGNTQIPPDGAVIQARGAAAARLVTDAPAGTTVTVRFTLNPIWDGVVDAIGGGPLIVRNGTPVYRANEGFSTGQLSPRVPRTAVGQRADGKILLVAVDGRQTGYSVGMSNFELALAMMQLGAVTASALDSGGSTTMAFDGALLNRPSDQAGERLVADALLVTYTGVYVPPMAEPVLSPNGDGVAEMQSFGYKIVRPSTVQATLVGPNNVTLPVDAGPRAPAAYRFTWNGSGPDGAQEPEGSWRFVVTAIDDAGTASAADRPFTLNDTLADVGVAPSVLDLNANGTTRLVGSFVLSRAATITATVETTKGVVLRVLASRSFAAGTRNVTWDGRNGAGALAYAGAYVLHVSATNEFGRVDLYAAFRARR
jgi:hypothetical protein